MKKNFLLLFCFITTFVFCQKYTFYYELDYHKANGNTKLGIMRLGLNEAEPVLQLYKPNDHLFAVIRDFANKKRHYFYYSNKNGEKYKYIGTVSDMKEMKDLFNIKSITDQEYTKIEKIILLHKEFGENNAYYVTKDNVNEEEVLMYTSKSETLRQLKEIRLNPTIKKEVVIHLPMKLKNISFSKIQNLTACIVSTSYKNLSEIGHFGQEKVTKNTCD
ncbi:hypothetical protein [Chryseobacterium sp. 3008163]|uniref:hypothetical protein n=1 Tax=Chryseobacterium sp. 3008163 TaxID=2478663 RepID=UPI000F0C3BC3|nr:hypothetical protein [Chryseobacterium sp. 3008163]AYM99726.1 hypothetical protein EAG08_04690 [Chryseobacterium sp. 3008163]